MVQFVETAPVNQVKQRLHVRRIVVEVEVEAVQLAETAPVNQVKLRHVGRIAVGPAAEPAAASLRRPLTLRTSTAIVWQATMNCQK